MKILVACLDQELLWAIDDVVSGLYSIDQKTLETKCVIDCQKLFPYGKFEILSLFKWKEDYIVLVPLEIDKSWILYNKVTGRTEYRKVIEKKCQEILIAVDQERNQLYFFPLHIQDPILIVDLNTLTYLNTIDNWSVGVSRDCYETAWKGAYNDRYMFFPIKNTRILVRMDCETRKVNLLELDISEGLIYADYAFGELWVLPMKGNRLYQIDEDGRIVNTVELLVENAADSLPDFARIVVQKRYLFLLPCYRKGIYVYDKLEGKTHIIVEKHPVLEKKDKEIYLRYWEYYVKGSQICFLPFKDNYMEIDLDTLAYKEKELSYPNIWSNKEKIRRIICSQASEGDSIIRETDGCGLEIFLEYVQDKENRKKFLKNRYASEKIWGILKN